MSILLSIYLGGVLGVGSMSWATDEAGMCGLGKHLCLALLWPIGVPFILYSKLTYGR